MTKKVFIKDRFIEENIRLTYDMINYCAKNKPKGLVVLVDFEKAFHSINWEYISKILKMFNFGHKVISWI